MKEEIVHFIWLNSFVGKEFILTDKRNCTIVFPGHLNFGSGPDFEEAKIKIDGITFTGNIEIHLRSSDWKKHGHHHDPAYDNIILHIVLLNDEILWDSNGKLIPTLVIDVNVYEKAAKQIQSLINKNKSHLICAENIFEVPSALLDSVKNQMLDLQIQNKIERIDSIRKRCLNDWNETAWILTSRAMGLVHNADTMELLAYRIPWKTILSCRNETSKFEALLFGQAGLLPENGADEYSDRIINEYKLLKKKYSLVPLEKRSWKFAPIRPSSRPEIRLAQIAMIIKKHDSLINLFESVNHPDDLHKELDIELSEYWKFHNSFGKSGHINNSKLGPSLLNSLLINAIIPFRIYRATLLNEKNKIATAIELLNKMGPEENSITKQFISKGISINNAADSQSIIYLYKNLCCKKKCLKCNIFKSICSK